MKCFRKQKVKVAVPTQHVTHQEDSRLILHVFHAVFWYMRLCGLVVPFACSHDPQFQKGAGQVKQSSQFDQTTTDMKATSTDKEEDSRTEADGMPGIEKIETIHNIVNPREVTGVADGLPEADNRDKRNAEISSFTKRNWAKNTQVQAKSKKNHPVSNCSKYSSGANLVRTEPRQDELIQDTNGKHRVQQCEQNSSQNVVHMHTSGICCDVADSHTRATFASDPNSCEESREGEPSRCAKCHVLVLWNRVLCVAVSVLLTLNCLRYSSAFFMKKYDTVHLLSVINYQIFFIGVTLMYILSAFEIAKHVPQLLEGLQQFDNIYGISLDLGDYRKRTERVCRISFTVHFVFGMIFALMEQFMTPSLQHLLSPFQNAQGVGLYLAKIIFTLLVIFITHFVVFMFGFMATATYGLVFEFNKLSSDLRQVLAKPGTVLVPSAQDVPLTGGNTSLNSAASADRLDDGGCCRRRSLTQPSMNSDRSPAALVSSHEGSDTKHDSHRMPHTAGNDTKIQHGCEMSEHVRNTQSIRHHSSHLGHPQLPARSGQETSQSLPDSREHNDRSSSGDLRGNEYVAPGTVSQEAKFDILRAKHQTLCELVAKANQCVRHFVSLLFGGALPLTCLIIYVLSSGSVDLTNVLFLSHNLCYIAAYLVLIVLHAFHTRDAAHAVQEVIYAADWSQFSDRLLTKVHLFTSRLGYSRIGYDVYGLFVIDRSTVLMVAGTLVTYTVVVIQFQQAEVPPCVTGANTTAPS